MLGRLLYLAKLKLPGVLVEQEIKRINTDVQKRLSQVSGKWMCYLEQAGRTPVKLKEASRTQAKRNVRFGLILGKLVQLENSKDSDKAGQEVFGWILAHAIK